MRLETAGTNVPGDCEGATDTVAQKDRFTASPDDDGTAHEPVDLHRLGVVAEVHGAIAQIGQIKRLSAANKRE
jgi:hypothetical protein